MSVTDLIRAWQDPEYRATLPADVRAQLQAHPAGNPSVQLGETDDDGGYEDFFGLGSCCPPTDEPACCPCNTNDDWCTGNCTLPP
jgi:mersacidin/lichenicidin family type 2 lantibiotic